MYYGQYLAWISFCLLTLEYGMSAALNAIGFVHSIKQAFSHSGVELPLWLFEFPIYGTLKISIISCLTVLALTAFMLRGIEDSIKLNNFMTVIIIGFFLFCTSITAVNFDQSHWDTFKTTESSTLSGIFKACCISYFAYTSFEQPITVSEESVNPKKDIPQTLIIQVVFMTL
jgi:amino acid transporter